MTETEASLSYNEIFPSLGKKDNTLHNVNLINNGLRKSDDKNSHVVLPSSTVTEILSISMKERKYPTNDPKQLDEISLIQKSFPFVNITSSFSKDHSLTVVVHGPYESVQKVKKSIQKVTQIQNSVEIKVPQEYMKRLIGKKKSNINSLQEKTGTKILVDYDKGLVSIQGTSDAIKTASAKIEQFCYEFKKSHKTVIKVPCHLHNLIRGFHDSNLQYIINKIDPTNGLKIIMPKNKGKSTTDHEDGASEEIVLIGEKIFVEKAYEVIKEQSEKLIKTVTTTVIDIIKVLHKSLIIDRVADMIFKTTGVIINIPPLDSQDSTISLFGCSDDIGNAVGILMEKVASEACIIIPAPSWMHPYIQGRKKENLIAIKNTFPEVTLNFDNTHDIISLAGPHSKAEKVEEILRQSVYEMHNSMDHIELHIAPKWFPLIIGKNGTVIKTIKDETKTCINVPSNTTENSSIIIDGPRAGVAKARDEIMKIVKKNENQITVEIQLEAHLQNLVLGNKGENLRKILNQIPSGDVHMVFPGSNSKSNLIKIYGSKEGVEMASNIIGKLRKELLLSHQSVEFSLPNKFRSLIIGKNGAMVKSIKEESGVESIRFPDDKENIVVLVGNAKAIQKATEKINAIQQKIETIQKITVEIPRRYNQMLLANNAQIIKNISSNCDNVRITLPDQGDKIEIAGSADGCEKARTQLLKIACENVDNFYTEEIKIKKEYHPHLIGKKGMHVKKIMTTTSTQIVFPSVEESDKELVVITGSKVNVEKAKSLIKDLISKTESIVTETIECERSVLNKMTNGKPPSFFLSEKLQVLVKLGPKSEANPDKILLNLIGVNTDVVAAKNTFNKMIEDIKAIVNKDIYFEQSQCRLLSSKYNTELQSTLTSHNVLLKKTNNKNELSQECWTFSGLPNNIDVVHDKIMKLLPITLNLPVPSTYHSGLIGRNGTGIASLIKESNVKLVFPKDSSDNVQIIGMETSAQDVKNRILAKVEEIKRQNEERELKRYSIQMEFPKKWFVKFIGVKGKAIKEFSDKYSVQILTNRRSEAKNASNKTVLAKSDVVVLKEEQTTDEATNLKDGDHETDKQTTPEIIQNEKQNSSESNETITIMGLQSLVDKAHTDILQMIERWESSVEETVQVDKSLHPKIIGQKGTNLKKLIKQFHVQNISIDKDTHKINIVGLKQHVDALKSHLIKMNEDYLDETEGVSMYLLNTRNKKSMNDYDSKITSYSSKNKNHKPPTMNGESLVPLETLSNHVVTSSYSNNDNRSNIESIKSYSDVVCSAKP